MVINKMYSAEEFRNLCLISRGPQECALLKIATKDGSEKQVIYQQIDPSFTRITVVLASEYLKSLIRPHSSYNLKDLKHVILIAQDYMIHWEVEREKELDKQFEIILRKAPGISSIFENSMAKKEKNQDRQLEKAHQKIPEVISIIKNYLDKEWDAF